ncbi:MAG: hypothetical protein RAP70_00120 [Candidatus Celaenobacter antarcticus]|nr:hypothetical protein [Candidatus Celaenobacter antarcticus]
MKKILYILLILSLFLLFLSCSKWVKSINGDGICLPYESDYHQGITIIVDTLSSLHFGYSVYETDAQIQISSVNNFSTLLFDSLCHEYIYVQIPEISLTYFAQIPIEMFIMNTTYFCRRRYMSENCFPPANYEWSDWSRVGYFTLALSQDD